jgi:hypothetical protein
MLERAQFTAKPLNFQRTGKHPIWDGARCPYQHRFIPRLRFWRGSVVIDISAELDCQVIGEKLKRDDSQDGHYVLRRLR